MNEHQSWMIFFQYQRQIFGICPCCGEFFRLSDCKIYKDQKPPADWLDKLNKTERQLQIREEKIEEQLEALQEAHKEKGRRTANRLVKKIDGVFAPLKLNPDDAKVIFHPVDYLVFNGMKNAKTEGINDLIILDSVKTSTEGKSIQKSIQNAIEKEAYEWITLRVENNGQIKEE